MNRSRYDEILTPIGLSLSLSICLQLVLNLSPWYPGMLMVGSMGSQDGSSWFEWSHTLLRRNLQVRVHRALQVFPRIAQLGMESAAVQSQCPCRSIGAAHWMCLYRRPTSRPRHHCHCHLAQPQHLLGHCQSHHDYVCSSLHDLLLLHGCSHRRRSWSCHP